MALWGALLGLLLGVVLAFWTASPASASDESFAESQRVTAIDLLVEVYPKLVEGIIDPVWQRPPGDLEPSDFEITDGESRPVIALETAIEEPWRIVIHVDRHLASTHSIRRAASRLAAYATELTDLGTVEIVGADPELRPILAPTRDADLVNASLSHIALRGSADGKLLSLRAEFLDGRDDPDVELPAAALAELYAAEEHRRIEQQFDDLLLRLLDTGEPRDRKALLLLTDGFDLEPLSFYRGAIDDADPLGDRGLRESYGAFARAVSAYGWVVVPIFDPLVYEYPDRIGPRRALLMKIDRNRDPKRAEALLELGRSQLAQGEWSKAERTLEQSIHRFYDHPKTQARQASAELLLAEALRAQGRHEAAELAERRAVALDPARAAEATGATARVLDSQTPLALLAAGSVGVVADDDEALRRVLKSLHRRVRITYQVAGPPTGAVRPVSLALERIGYGVRGPSWVRSSTPEAVAAARVRRLLRVDSPRTDNELQIEGKLAADELIARVALATEESALTSGPLRVTLGIGGSEMLPWIDHALVDPEQTSYEKRLPTPPEAEWLAVLIEDLGTGARRQAVVDIVEAN